MTPSPVPGSVPASPVAGLTALAVLLAGAAGAETAVPAPADPAYKVARFTIQYRAPHPDQSDLAPLGALRVPLARTATGFAAPAAAGPVEEVALTWPGSEPARDFRASALREIAGALLRAMQQRGLLGVSVAPHPEDIDPATGADLRPPGDETLRFVVATGRLRELRTVGFGDRIQDGWRVDHRMHRQIRERSPLQPTPFVDEQSTDLLEKDTLEDYLFRLNRHPGRRVAAALSASEDGDGVALDYRVSEPRPWFAYAQASNTGTSSTDEWQQRFGFVHRQLRDRDDLLSVEYLTAGFEALHAVRLSYEAPWFGSRRPRWYRSKDDEPFWQRWLHRDALPWPGSDRVRWGVHGGYSIFRARSIEGIDDVDGEEWNVGGEVVWNAFQHRALFVDLAGTLRFRSIASENLANAQTNEADFLMPGVALRASRVTDYSSLGLRTRFEGVFGDGAVDGLGRPSGVDEDAELLSFDLGVSHYLEPLLNGAAWRDPSSTGSSKLAHEIAIGARGQHSFDRRLVPQFSQVLGGLHSIRGYTQSAATGDSVVVGSFEYRFHLPNQLGLQREPVRLPWIGDFRVAPQQVYGRADWDLVLRAFVDAGYAERVGGFANEPDNVLLGVGVGAELRFKRYLRARVDWARALSSMDPRSSRRVVAGDDEIHFLMSIVY